MKRPFSLILAITLLGPALSVLAQNDNSAGLAVAGAAKPVPQTEKAPDVSIIPAPAKCERLAGSFTVDAGTKIFCSAGEATATALVLQSDLKTHAGLNLALDASSSNTLAGIRLELTEPGIDSAEDYTLEITSNGVALRASSEAGLFYGVQSVLQMADAQVVAPGEALHFPAVRISDHPRFAWRGLMLDESRHFFGQQVVEQVLDVMAYLKLNRFHWHLTDEPGWRIEIKEYPKLTTVGARGDLNNHQPDAPVCFYTQAEVREIVEYAAQRHIVVIPEIDMPGHATAATHAYPEYSAGGTGKWDGFTFNPAKEQTYVFLGNILKEVAGMFPGPYLHLGGDEVRYGNKSWSTDPEIVKFTHDHGMTNADELEHYFVRRMVADVNKLGKITIGWDELASSGVTPSQTILMWWRQDKPAVLTGALEKNYSIVLCPRMPCYFDFKQDKAHKYGRHFNDGKIVSTAELYRFPDSTINGLVPADKMANVLGIQANVWTEMISTSERLAFMTCPRVAALAESAWTPAAAKNSTNFFSRLPGFYHELDRREIPYFDVFDPASTPEPQY